jgi:hypothetical protein
MWGIRDLLDPRTGDVVGSVIDMQEGRYWGECPMCETEQRLDHAVGWCCGPTHDDIGTMSTEYRDTEVGGMCVCKSCHDQFYAT